MTQDGMRTQSMKKKLLKTVKLFFTLGINGYIYITIKINGYEQGKN